MFLPFSFFQCEVTVVCKILVGGWDGDLGRISDRTVACFVFVCPTVSPD